MRSGRLTEMRAVFEKYPDNILPRVKVNTFKMINVCLILNRCMYLLSLSYER